jgi:hypothetical protein
MGSDNLFKRVELNLSKIHSFCEVIVAERASPVKYAISPKHSPLSKAATCLLPFSTSTWPLIKI